MNEKCHNNGKCEINYVVKLETTICERSDSSNFSPHKIFQISP